MNISARVMNQIIHSLAIFCSTLESYNIAAFHGETLRINDFHFIHDNDDTLYWTMFENDDLAKMNEFIKTVRIGKLKCWPIFLFILLNHKIEILILCLWWISVEQEDDELRFNDDFFKFTINLTKGKLFIFPYDTA